MSTPTHRASVAIAATLLATALAIPALGGCTNDTEQPAGSDVIAPVNSGAPSATDGEVAGSAAGDSASSDTFAFDYSEGITADGMWEGVAASEIVTLPADYAAISVPASVVAISDAEVRSHMDSVASYYGATASPVTDRAVEDGDTVNIDYVGKIDGVAFDTGSTYTTDADGNQVAHGTDVTVGVTNYIDDFLQQLIGHKPGETFDIEVTFPDNYGKDELNGKDAVFTVTINYITDLGVTDEWVQNNVADLYGCTTVDEFKAALRAEMERGSIKTYVQDYVIGNSQVSEIPDSMVQYQRGALLAYYQGLADSYDMDVNEMISMVTGGGTVDELLDSNSDAIGLTVSSYLVYQAIAEEQGISVSEDEMRAFAADSFGQANVDAYLDHYGDNYIKLGALIDKVTNFLTDNATVAK